MHTPSGHLRDRFHELIAAYGWHSHNMQRVPHAGRDGRWIECDANGHCRWTASTSVDEARRRIYEASRGRLDVAIRVQSECGFTRCVNVDHLRAERNTTPRTAGQCLRGHAL